MPDALAHSGSKLRQAVKDNALASVALQRLLETGQVIELKYKKQRLCIHSAEAISNRREYIEMCQTQSYLRIGQRYLRMTQNPL
jgi:hypothetical protein